MRTRRITVSTDQLTPFDRNALETRETFTYIGNGAIGGKASGLAFIRDILARHFDEKSFPGITVDIPRLTVLTTDVFDRFMERNGLYDSLDDELSDDRIAHLFQNAQLPAELVGDLRALTASITTPLAIRSSSLLEDAMYEPFAGVYGTKMIPNNQPDIDTRFKKLVEAIKFVYASTFFKNARDYIKATGKSSRDEKMAVIIQDVVGNRYSDRFYPHLAGVARTYNFYCMGHARPEDGVVDLALGLGKTIVDGGLAWSYSPAYPRANPPVGSPRELLKLTQTEFWAVNMGKPPMYDPTREVEYLIRGYLADAEYDGTLRYAVSTYRAQDDRIVTGMGTPGPRLVTFAPILITNLVPLNDLLTTLLHVCEKAVGSEVEIEFAVTLDSKKALPARFGFLQVRPMVVSHEKVDLTPDELHGDNVLAASETVLGNGIDTSLTDIVYVCPETFNAKHTREIAEELETFNRRLREAGRRYLLIGFGRWGSSDPWLGIPVNWGQISGAGMIVEATLPDMDVDLSQGAHFFHNITSFQICYFCVRHSGPYRINWEWLKRQNEVARSRFVSYVILDKPLTVKVDGRGGRGVILT